MNKIFNNNAKAPFLILAPMAGINDKAFRNVCKDFGADITWSEMVSAHGLVFSKNKKSLALAKRYSSQEKPFAVQIFGGDPEILAKAAQIIEKKIKPEIIDLNFGCPVPKAIKAGYGAVQLKNPKQLIECITVVKSAISTSLSVKTRLGWQDPREILKLAPKIQKAGADILVLHARTYKEGFNCQPHWEIVKKVKELIDIPIIYNGGINSPELAADYWKKTGADGIMIGQGAWGKPWIFKQIKEYLATGKYLNPYQNNLEEIRKVILCHAQLAHKYNPERGIIEMRKHLGWYLKGMPHAFVNSIRTLPYPGLLSIMEKPISLEKYGR